VTVIRSGKPVSSPDILIENTIITVTADVRLTPRASSRMDALNQQRQELGAKLAELAPKLSKMSNAQATVSECQHILNDDLRFGADLDFVARSIAHLERLAQNQLGSGSQRPPMQIINTGPVFTVALVGALLTVAIFWPRNRPAYPAGAARYREALADVGAAFKNPGPVLTCGTKRRNVYSDEAAADSRLLVQQIESQAVT
jgi:hypothetical protein